MTIEEMKEKKRELGYSIETLSKLSDVPESTLKKIFSNETKNPRQVTIEKLTAILDINTEPSSEILENEFGKKYIFGSAALKKNPYLAGKKQGEFTIEDYYNLPDDERYELIDGVLFDMSAPTRNHQVITGYLYHCLMNCIDEHKMNSRPYISPLDVQLDKDNRTMVQPDVIICCDENEDIGQRIFGAPDFAAEVLSSSTAKKDKAAKYYKYLVAGVREYWIIDIKRQKVIVHLLSEDDDTFIYTFDDNIPIFISDGKCKVSFASIKGQLNDE